MTEQDLIHYCRYYKGNDEYSELHNHHDFLTYYYQCAERNFVHNFNTQKRLDDINSFFSGFEFSENDINSLPNDVPLYLYVCLFFTYLHIAEHSAYGMLDYKAEKQRFMSDFFPGYLGVTYK